MKVFWSEQALRRLAAIEEYVARDDPSAAERLVDRLVMRGQALNRFPRRGRRLPEWPQSGLLEIVDRNYRIVYRLNARRVEIVTVFETHRRFPWGDLD